VARASIDARLQIAAGVLRGRAHRAHRGLGLRRRLREISGGAQRAVLPRAQRLQLLDRDARSRTGTPPTSARARLR
jgi:hypothetical protein